MKRFLFFISCMLLTISQAWAIVIPTTAKVPAAGSIVTQPLTSVTFTYDKEIASITTTNSTITNTLLVQGKTQTEKIFATLSTTVISSDKKTVTFTLPKAITIPQVYDVTLVGYVNFVDGSTSNWDRYTFTYAEPQLDPVSSLPGDGEPHEGYLTSYSLTYDQPITNTPAADGLKISGLTQYTDPKYEMTKNYEVVATSTKATLSADKKTVTYAIDLNYYGSEFFATLDYAALEFAGAKNAPVKRWINNYINPDVQLYGNGIQYANGATINQLDYIYLKYPQCNSGWPVSVVGIDNANDAVFWLQKNKGGEWINYQTVRLKFPETGDDSKTAMIVPAVVNDKGEITEKKNIFRPGQYQLVVPAGSVFTSLFKRSNPVDQLMNQEMVITFNIAGDENTEWLSPLSTTPADKDKVSNQLSQFILSYPMPITNVPQASTLKVYDEAGSQLLGTATSVTVSADKKTITYALASPVTKWGTVNVQLDGNVLSGEGWTNEPVSRRVTIQERREIFVSMPEDTWRIMGLRIAMTGNPGKLEGNNNYLESFPVCNSNGEHVGYTSISTFNVEYDSESKTCLVPKVEQSWMIGEGDYYVDLPAGFLRCAAEKATIDGETVVTRWIESEATRLEFHLGPQLPTQFTADKAGTNQTYQITDFTLTITEAEELYLHNSEYIWVSKDGGKPLKYLLYDYDRDGEPTGTNSEYASSGNLVIDTNTPNKVKFTIQEGFKSLNDDSFGFLGKGEYTITIPAGMFEIDGSYYNTDMTFSYHVTTGKIETRNFKGDFEVTPAAGDTLTSANQLKEIYVKFKDADNITLSNVRATVNGGSNTYLTLNRVEKVNGTTWKFVMNRNDSVAEYQDKNLVFTFEAEVEADGKNFVYTTDDDYMGGATFYETNKFATTWRYMTPVEYGANYVLFSPNYSEEVESLSVISVTPIDGYKFYNVFKTDKMDIFLNGAKMEGYYAKSANNPSSNTGTLSVYDANNQKATLTEPGVYTIHVPAGCFPVQDAANHEIMSKAETVSVKIAGETITDINRDGNMDVADVTALVDIVLGKDNVEPYKYDHKAADVNGDGKFDVSDVTALVNLILNKK